MIQAEFLTQSGELCGCRLSGHAGFADYGEDIVCASVTSALQLTANGITEIIKAPVQVSVLENEISVVLKAPVSPCARAFLQALKLHLEVLAQEYEGTIQIKVSEV